jgi:lipid II:glycine glycyltransferase (peptidoglycan interpeptide bridge formation enzyme)
MSCNYRQSDKYADYMERIGWQVEEIDQAKVFIQSIPWVGSIVKVPRCPWPVEVELLVAIGQQRRAMTVKMDFNIVTKTESELLSLFKNYHFKPDRWPVSPQTSLLVDLKPSLKRLQLSFSKDARYQLRKAKQAGLMISQGDPESFHHHWRRTQRQLLLPSWQEFTSLRQAFGHDINLITCREAATGQWLGGVVLLKHESTMYYLYAVASIQGKALACPYLLVWQGMQLAKKLKCTRWDFEGIVDDRYKYMRSPAWQGFSLFKRKFGGEEVKYVGGVVRYAGWGKVIEWLDPIFN